ncbi:uncharacterized protein LOC120351437 [Nilaparvata lugens]|uniref:uncharacterized protein LOC120351437 n=1 Tax=Nilaparvata lugens TaxID=108931 RepID=UPI00193C9647|nr:uncharacterized protein LOC120351437 [Nilaparvata lugens]
MNMNLMSWDIQFKRIENCKNRGTGDIDLDLRLKRISRTRVNMEGNITFKVDFDDNMKGVFDLSSWGNGGWRSNAYRVTVDNPCSTNSVFAAFFNKVRKLAGMPETCPIPAGRYELKDFDTQIVNNITLPFYIIPTTWKITLSYYHRSNNKRLGCKSFIAESRVKSIKKMND